MAGLEGIHCTDLCHSFFILIVYLITIELVLSLEKRGQVNESENAVACIAFSAQFATNFMLNAMPSVNVNASIPDEGTLIGS